MSRFYIPLDKITGIKTLPNFSPITTINRNGLNGAFQNCTGLKGSVSFPNLTSIGDYGLQYAFYSCIELTGSISFPSLTTIASYGLQNTFNGCTGITEVYFKSSLSGNSQCTRSYMGCSKATIYFSLP